MMSHMSRMCSRMSSGRPLSGRGIVSAGDLLLLPRPLGSSAAPGALDARFHFADAGQVFVELGLIGVS